MSVDDDKKQFSLKTNKSFEIEDEQKLPRRFISGREYFQFRCRLSDVSDNDSVTKLSVAGLYTDARFRADVKEGIGGFKVTFDGCDARHHFNWRQILRNPSSFMFFGAPLSMCRSFDNVFKSLNTSESLNNRFVLYYDHVEGDVEASVSLYNSYMARKCKVLENKLKDKENEALNKSCDGGIFISEKCVDFCNRFNKVCMDAIESVLTEFQSHSQPIISTPTMKEFIAEAPAIFGTVWDLMCELRGVHETHTHTRSIVQKARRIRCFLSSCLSFEYGIGRG